ncbi:MAG: hypothetical protein KA152_06885 [Verrucomicrobiales bacterium]|nr:hypothetical protein [Verrucomicrobiales bacterium]
MPNPSATLFSPEEEEETWAIVELMGRSRVAGRISRDTQFGTGLLMLDVPYCQGFIRQFLGSEGAIFRITICDEEIARATQEARRLEPDIGLSFRKWQDNEIVRDTKEMLSPSYEPDFSVGEVGRSICDKAGNVVGTVY